jgi:hypothetical protein
MSGLTTIVDASPSFVPGVFDGQDVRLAALGNKLPGVFANGDFAVSERAAGANMSVDIAAGRAFVEPADIARQGVYAAWMGSTFNTSSDGGYVWAAADATNPRIDLVCIEVRDTDFGGTYTGFRYRIVDGTPNAGATHQLVTAQWPAIPAGCVPIAAVRVPAGATTLTAANITSLNAVGGDRFSWNSISAVDTTTSATYTRLANPDAVCVYVPHAASIVRVVYKAQWKSAAAATGGVALFINGSQLKGPVAGGAPAVMGFELALGTANVYAHLHSATISQGDAFATVGAFHSVLPATADVSDVTTGQAFTAAGNTTLQAGSAVSGPIDVIGLTAGWYVFEVRYKTSASTLSVRNRTLRAEVKF